MVQMKNTELPHILANRIDLTFPVPGKQAVMFSIPGNMDENDWAMIKDMINAFAARLLLKNKK